VFVTVTLFVIVIVEHGFEAAGTHEDELIVPVIPGTTLQLYGGTL